MAVTGHLRIRRCGFGRVAVIISLAILSAIAGLTSQALAQRSADALPAGLASDTVTTAPGESTVAPNPGPVSHVTLLRVPAETLPGQVYVLSNGELVTEKPSPQCRKLQETVEDSSTSRATASRSATVRASVKVLASRLIVVDENDTITEIWSNTTGSDDTFYFYCLRVKAGEVRGSEHPLTPGVVAQYNRLLGEVDWSKMDQVYGSRK